MPLSSRQKRYLRGLAHALDPVVIVGQKGVTPSLLKELDGALAHHELIKVRLAEADREDRAETTEALCESANAELVQTIGRVVSLYRRNRDEPKIELPVEPKKRR